MLRRSFPYLALLCAACAASPPPPPPAPAAAPVRETAKFVTASIAANSCGTLVGANGHLAEEAMQKLVDPCTSVPGGSTKFTVTLLPGGRIEFPPGADQPETIPTCVLRNGLKHRVSLSKACSLVVKLDETSVALPSGGRDGGADAR